MKLSLIKKQLEEAGSSYELLLAEFVNSGKPDIKCYDSAHEVIMCIVWRSSLKGHKYWEKIYNKLYKKSVVSKRGECIPNYPILKLEGNDSWEVGCQAISRKQRKKLFKLLAEDLGYEIIN